MEVPVLQAAVAYPVRKTLALDLNSNMDSTWRRSQLGCHTCLSLEGRYLSGVQGFASSSVHATCDFRAGIEDTLVAVESVAGQRVGEKGGPQATAWRVVS